MRNNKISISKSNGQPLVGIFYNRKPNKNGYLNAVKQFRHSLHELSEVFEGRNMRMVLLCEERSYVGHGLFCGYWSPDSTKKGKFINHKETIRPNLVYDKGHFSSNDGFIKIFNPSNFSKLGRNKYTQSLLFKSLVPSTELVLPGESLTHAVSAVSSDLVVIKPLHLNGGRSIEVVGATEAKRMVAPDFLLVQEFIETNKGVSGLTKGRHDLRLYVLNGKPALVSIRNPRSGGYLSNTKQGGRITFLSANKVPPGILQILKKINSHLALYQPRYYSADFMFDGKKWWLIEINDRPGIPAVFQSSLIPRFHEKFVTLCEQEIAND